MSAISKFLPRYKAKKFEEAPSWVLAMLGVPCFLMASYFTLMFAAVLPDLIKATNGREINLSQAAALWSLLAPYAAIVWLSGCIAKRCHDLLYKRWFA